MEEALVILSEKGALKKKERVKVESVIGFVKEKSTEAIEMWDPTRSDFSVIRDEYPVPLELPIRPEDYERYKKYGLQRIDSKTATVRVPVYVISFDNVIVEDSYRDNRVILVAPWVDEKVEEELCKYAVELTKSEC